MSASGKKASYGALLGSPGVAGLVPPMVLARLPIGATAVLLVLFVSLKHGAFFAGLTSSAMTLGTALAAPFLGRLVDKGHGPAVLIASAAAQLAAMLLLVLCVELSLPAPIAVLLAALAGVCTPPVAGTTRSLWPSIVSETLLSTAYNFEIFLIDVLYVTGPLMASVFIAVGVPHVGLIFVMSGQLVGTVWLALSKPVRAQAASHRLAVGPTSLADASAGDVTHSSRAGKGNALLRDKRIALLLLVCLLTNAFSGALETILPLWYSANGDAGGSGFAIALWSVASIVGVLAFARFQPDRYRFRLALQLMSVTAVYFAAGLGLVAHGIAPIALLSAVVAIGLTVSPCTSLHYQLSGELAPKEHHAEMFSWLNTATSAGISAGAFAIGIVTDAVGFDLGFSIGSVFVALALGLSFALWGVCRREEPSLR